MSGNATGLTLAAWQALGGAEQAVCRAAATRELQRSGAHYVIDSVADLLPVLDDIDARRVRGERP